MYEYEATALRICGRRAGGGGTEAVTGGHAESISAWVNDALRLKADHDRRLQALDGFLAAWEAGAGRSLTMRCGTLPVEHANEPSW